MEAAEKSSSHLFLNFSFLTLFVFLTQKYARSLFSSGLGFWSPKLVVVCERHFQLEWSVSLTLQIHDSKKVNGL